jgi:hypothetical protein
MPDEPGYKKRIFVNSDGQFSIVLPVFAQKAMGLREITGKSLDDVKSQFTKVVANARAARTSSIRVIRYKVERPWSSAGGVQVALIARVFDRQDLVTEGGTRSNYEIVDDSNLLTNLWPGSMLDLLERDAGTREIPWTAERENWFNNLGLALLGIEQKLKTLNDPQLAIGLADGGNLLPETT